MTEPKHRLMQAIREAGYEKPTDAWRDHKRELGISQDLMISNTNGNRPISRKAAEKYAQVFGHSAGWYLYGEANNEAPLARPIGPNPLTVRLGDLFAEILKADEDIQIEAVRVLENVLPSRQRSRLTKAKVQ